MAGKLGTRGALGMLAYDGEGTHGVVGARAGLLSNHCKLLAKDDCPSSLAKLTSARGHGGGGPTFA
jgi:hypothetical protein